jgi:hypothetical protein
MFPLWILSIVWAEGNAAHWTRELVVWICFLGFLVPNLVKLYRACPRCHESFFGLAFDQRCRGCGLALREPD